MNRQGTSWKNVPLNLHIMSLVSTLAVQVAMDVHQLGVTVRAEHIGALAEQAFVLHEELSVGIARQLRLTTERTGTGRKFWYQPEGEVLDPQLPPSSVTSRRLACAHALYKQGEQVHPAFLQALERPVPMETGLITEPLLLRGAYIEALSAPYMLVALLHDGRLSKEEARLEGYQMAAQFVDADLVGSLDRSNLRDVLPTPPSGGQDA